MRKELKKDDRYLKSPEEKNSRLAHLLNVSMRHKNVVRINRVENHEERGWLFEVK